MAKKKEKKYEVLFYRDKCEENRVCEARCSKYWNFNEEKGKIYLEGMEEIKKKNEETGEMEGTNVFKIEIGKEDLECNKAAEAGCPKDAIKVKPIESK